VYVHGDKRRRPSRTLPAQIENENRKTEAVPVGAAFAQAGSANRHDYKHMFFLRFEKMM
jgi:hypothetical protein